MRREMHPQRWGDPDRAAALVEPTRGLVELAFGIHDRPAVAEVTVPASRLAGPAYDALVAAVGADHVLVDADARRRRTRGKSTPDLLRARAGDLADAPDAVVRPADHDQVAAVLAAAVAHDLVVVPFGGGTAVTGGLAPERDARAVVSLDLGRLDAVLALDEVSRTATLQPGLRGPEAEALLAENGFTLGHLPQSFEWASIGGFAATRSSGQASAGYGRFDAMVVGLRAATPSGELRLGTAPASAAGPDLRQVLLGSEGTLGVITEVTVRVRPLPEVRRYAGWLWPDFATGQRAMRALAQAGELPTVLRLSDETETGLNLVHPDAIGGEGRPDGCLMVVGHEGTAAQVERRSAVASELLADLGGHDLGAGPGEAWAAGRFDAPYLRDAMLDAGVLVETLETAAFWSALPRLYDEVRAALTDALPGALVLCHVSHVYETGASLYFTVAAPGGEDPLATWAPAKRAACDAIVRAGATITHHHAVGTDHRPWLAEEIGPVGIRMLRALKAEVDPAGVLNPGVLVP